MPEPLQSTTPQKSPSKEPAIYTIPDEYYGAAAKARLAPEPSAVSGAAQMMASAPRPVASPSSGGKRWILLPVIVLLLMIAGGVATWFFVFRKPSPETPAPTVTLPTPQPEPEPEPEPVPQPEPATTTDVVPQPEPATSTEIVPQAEPAWADGDNDGLTTVEETLYGTDPKSDDSDADGFSDSVEVTNLYNPAGFRPTRLIEAGLVVAYDGDGFAMLSPSKWTGGEVNGTLVTFTNPENETVTLAAIDNPDGQSALDWYLSRNPGVSPAQVLSFATKSGLQGVRSPDGLTAAIDGEGRMYLLTYAPTSPSAALFRATFTMMLNSFMRKP